jgi:hypothetical protein
MKSVGALIVTVLSSLSHDVCAQTGDAVDRLKACSQFEGVDRLKCIDKLLQEMAETPDLAQPRGSNWIISETTSPVDYRPQITALTTARAPSKDAPVLARHSLPRPSHGVDDFHDWLLETGHRWSGEGRMPDQRRAVC